MRSSVSRSTIPMPLERVVGAQASRDLAAVIVEPVMGAAGIIEPSEEFLHFSRELTEQHGIVLIFDEVISFRIAYGGAQTHYGVTPDLTTLGKIIGGGFPVGAFGGRRDIMELYNPADAPRVAHAGTFNANPVTMVAGSATLEQLTPDVYRDLAEATEHLRQGVRDICARLEVPVQVTGLGSLFGIHFTAGQAHNYRDLAAEDADLRTQVFFGLMNEGVLIAPNLVGALSTALSAAEIDAFLQAFDTVLRRLLQRRS